MVAAGLGVTRPPLSSRSLRDSGVAFVPFTDHEDACVELVWRAGAAHPALPMLRAVVHEVVRTLDLAAAG